VNATHPTKGETSDKPTFGEKFMVTTKRERKAPKETASAQKYSAQQEASLISRRAKE
jgi:hypothetical protein